MDLGKDHIGGPHIQSSYFPRYRLSQLVDHRNTIQIIKMTLPIIKQIPMIF